MKTTQELSWLRFNLRVLEQTRRADFPVLERMRFLGIWASNLDEFYAARISRPFLEERGSASYQTLLEEARAQVRLADDTYDALLPALEEQAIRIVPLKSLTREEKDYFGAFLAEEVAPRVDVVQGDAIREVRSQALYLASGRGVLEHLLRLPQAVPRLLEIPGRDGTYVRLGALVRSRRDLFLPRGSGELHEFRVVRLQAIDQRRMDWADLPAALESRLEGQVTHLEVEQGFPGHWTEAIRLALGLEREEVVEVRPPLDLRFVGKLVDDAPAAQKFPKLEAWHVPGFAQDAFSRIDRGDVLLYHPYQSYEAVEAFARQAGADPQVTAIRATLYRVGDDNVLASSLIAAARAGKDVSVLLEARARFDELQNLEWSLRFHYSGVRVLALPEKKVHAKVIWVRRGRRTYVHLGTGNYNTRNGRLYTDFSLFTSDRRLTGDAERFIDALERGEVPAPQHMRTGAAVRELLVERLLAEARPGGHAILKFNHLTDPEVLAAIAEASRRGARVDLLVRTTLTEIAPDVRARSLVGRFLEHARVAAFAEGGRWAVYAGSLDAMPRNFDRRYELFFPVRDPRAKAAVLAELRAQLADDVNAFELLEDGGQRAVWGGRLNSQHADDHRTSLEAPRHAKRGKEPRRREAGEPRSTLRSGGDQPPAGLHG
jgi:polyphosphate kinase